MFETITVPAMTFSTLVDGIDRIDVLHIDTEGHDAIILDHVDLARWRPAVVLYEHKHLPSDDNGSCRTRLRDAGYRLVANDDDTIAVLRGRRR